VFLHPQQSPAGAGDVEPTVRNLQAARQLADLSGARFLALLVDDRGADFRRDRQRLQARLQTLGIPYLAADDLIPAARWPLLRYPLDTHWNAAGHAAVGRALTPRIKALLARAPR
jgi:lysophospholipase L1-like esterase